VVFEIFDMDEMFELQLIEQDFIIVEADFEVQIRCEIIDVTIIN
jgi:hypothetical protein